MKILYNTTFSLLKEQEEKFVVYMKHSYIPSMMEGTALSRPMLSKITSENDEVTDVSYALQFVVPSREYLEELLRGKGQGCIETLLREFGNTLAGFVTVMEIVPL